MLREQMAEELFYEDWDAESGYAYANASNGYWGEQDEFLKDHYRKRAGIVLNLFRAEVEKLTVIDDEELAKLWKQAQQETANPMCHLDATEMMMELERDTQLQHTKKQLLDLMGE